MIQELGAIFDWDGVVIDSSLAHEQSWERLAEREDKVLPAGHFKEGFGRKNAFIIPQILKWCDSENEAEVVRLGDLKEAYYRDIIQEEGIEPLPGVEDLLRVLKAAGIPCSVGSSTPRANIDAVMGMIGFQDYFDQVVCADDVTKSKPDPQVFLTAAQRLNRAPENCVVFEDAFVGIEAALAGGMKVVAVATTNPLDRLHQANHAVNRLSDLSLNDVRALFESMPSS